MPTDPVLSQNYLAGIQVAWILAALVWLFAKGDEIPFVASGFLAYMASYRYFVVAAGLSSWVDLTPFGFLPITDQSALVALNYLVFGESVFLVAYMLTQTTSVELRRGILTRGCANWLRSCVFSTGAGACLLVFWVRGRMWAATDSGISMAQMSGYLYMAPMMLISIGILLAALWKVGLLNSLTHKAIALGLLFTVFSFTYGASGRFQFIGWLLAGVAILTTGSGVIHRAVVFGGGLALILALVAIAGTMRGSEGNALDRITSAEDANMLDGFVLIQRVYPSMLDYSFGMEHLGVLLRPIPRAWWPGKPVGGYMNKLGLTDWESGFCLGISPSLFGSFYQECGLIGVFLFSVLYGVAFAGLVKMSARAHPVAGLVLRGMVVASLIPLLRAGDLPGVYAWLGMAFWPCLLILWLKRRELRRV